MYDLTARMGLSGKDIHRYISMVQTMAAANTIAQFGSKLDTFKDLLNTTLEAQATAVRESANALRDMLNTKLEAQNAVLVSRLEAQNKTLDTELKAQSKILEAQNNRMAFMQWVIGLGFPLLIFLVALMAWWSRNAAP